MKFSSLFYLRAKQKVNLSSLSSFNMKISRVLCLNDVNRCNNAQQQPPHENSEINSKMSYSTLYRTIDPNSILVPSCALKNFVNFPKVIEREPINLIYSISTKFFTF